MLYNLGAGHTTNLGKANYFATFVSMISPVRYGSELLMKQIVRGKVGETFVLNMLGYTNTEMQCYMYALAISLVLFVVGWINLIRTNRYD